MKKIFNFPYDIGEKVFRKNLHKELGGSVQGGICPTASGRIILFSDPKVGGEFGYHDGWSNGVYLYYGEGQVGDMQFSRGNKAILNHKVDGKQLHLFMGAKKQVIYENEFEIDEQRPFELIESKDKNDDERISIVFRLKPIKKYKSKLPITKIDFMDETVIEIVESEKSNTENFTIGGTGERVGERRESKLVKEYKDYREKNNLSSLKSITIKPKGESKAITLRVDGWIDDEKILIEAKSSCTRNQIRLAIGQLLDYKRYLDPKQMAILLPSKPKGDLIKLISNLNIKLIYKLSKDSFEEV
tara:strand:+ start:248 stop:1150 length:903 start_codon:yes stop_codon:yes gene_type:complete